MWKEQNNHTDYYNNKKLKLSSKIVLKEKPVMVSQLGEVATRSIQPPPVIEDLDAETPVETPKNGRGLCRIL